MIPLIVSFARGGRSVAVFTEALGERRHHGRVVLLVNEHSASAAEMVAAFASEYGLATLVGTKTSGRLVATNAFKVRHGYRVALPVAAYYTWNGTNLEGVSVTPDVETALAPDTLWQGAALRFNARLPSRAVSELLHRGVTSSQSCGGSHRRHPAGTGVGTGGGLRESGHAPGMPSSARI